MTIENEEDLARLKAVGSVVARTLQAMGAALEGGMTSAELDAFGRKMLEVEGCVSAPESSTIRMRPSPNCLPARCRRWAATPC